MKNLEVYQIEACQNCVLVHCNGIENEREELHAEAIGLYQEKNNCRLASLGEDLGFRHYSCDICSGITENGSLAGDRTIIDVIKE